MKNKIISIISNITKLTFGELENNKDTESLWDSFSHIELIMTLEEEFNIKFEADEITQIKTVNKVIEFVIKKVKIEEFN